MWHYRCGLVPSLIVGAAAFGASELLLGGKKKETLKETNRTLYEILETAKAQNKEIERMIPFIEDEEMQKDLREINSTTDKIIFTISTKPNKLKKVSHFFDYYLPVTLKIIKKYDEIENQRLVSSDGKRFMEQAKKMIREINSAFQKQLAGMYQSDIVDADAEMKVLDTMLKADGFDSEGLEWNHGEEENRFE